MQTFANIDDLEKRWRPLSDDEKARANVLLEDASAFITNLIDGRVTYDPTNEIQAHNFTSVCCGMVKRAMFTDTGVTQESQSAVGYSASWTYSNPNGDLYVTKNDRKLLGVAGCHIGSIAPQVGGAAC